MTVLPAAGNGSVTPGARTDGRGADGPGHPVVLSERPLRRTTALLLLVLFGTSLAANAFGWHGCPHHGRRGSAGAGDGANPAVHASADVSGPASPASPSEPAGGACTCIGSCHADSAVPLGAGPAATLPGAAELAAAAISGPTDRPRRGPPAYFLPFPNGPPALG